MVLERSLYHELSMSIVIRLGNQNQRKTTYTRLIFWPLKSVWLEYLWSFGVHFSGKRNGQHYFLCLKIFLRRQKLSSEWTISGDYLLSAFPRVVFYHLYYSSFLSNVSMRDRKQKWNRLMIVLASATTVNHSKAPTFQKSLADNVDLWTTIQKNLTDVVQWPG